MATAAPPPVTRAVGDLHDHSPILPRRRESRTQLPPPRTASAGDAAAMELWDLIRSGQSTTSSAAVVAKRRPVAPAIASSSTSVQVPRYAAAQKGRTLIHPLLVQPTPEEERDHLTFLLSDDEVGVPLVTNSDVPVGRKSLTTMSRITPSSQKLIEIRESEREKECQYDHDVAEHGNEKADADAELRARLSRALLLGSRASLASVAVLPPPLPPKTLAIERHDDGYLVGDSFGFDYDDYCRDDGFGGPGGPSPTSTLNFPDPSMIHGTTAKTATATTMEMGHREPSEITYQPPLPPVSGGDDEPPRFGLDPSLDTEDEHRVPSPTSTLRFPPNEPVRHRKLPAVDGESGEEQEKMRKREVEEIGATMRPRRVTEMDRVSPQHTFVVCADTQIGMTSKNLEWETELGYCRAAVRRINTLMPRPRFVCICGDLVDMEHTFHVGESKSPEDRAEQSSSSSSAFTSKQECDRIQDRQNLDFQRCWVELHPDISLVCLCGNHDIGNRPTPSSIRRYTEAFGDDYLAFWVNGTYNVVLNNVLFNDPTGAVELYESQLRWLEERLIYACRHRAASIFVFAHHPWFLYHEDEDEKDLTGSVAFPREWDKPPTPDGKGNDLVEQEANKREGFPDYYFHIKKKYRREALALFRSYKVDACFVGHFHQNLISTTEWGMEHVVTAPLSMVFESSGVPPDQRRGGWEGSGRGIRIVEVDVDITAAYMNNGRVEGDEEAVGSMTATMKNQRRLWHRFEKI